MSAKMKDNWEHNEGRGVRFCKIMLGDFSRRMSIPEKFISQFKENLSEIVDLRGPCGNIWHVGLAKTASNTVLQYGWREFVEFHDLKEKDILLFEYEGDSCFSVFIFDSSECERQSSNKKNRNPPRMPATNAGKEAAMRLADEFTTKRPSFITVMKAYNVTTESRQFQLLISPKFAREFLPQESQEIVLRVPGSKKEWKVKYRATKSDFRFSANWRNFARDNGLEEGDACVFVLSKDKKKIAMEVHIFRAVNRATSSSSS